MKLPNRDRAFVDIKKLTEYVLDPTDARGKHKARVMKAALGFTKDNADDLREVLLSVVSENDCVLGELDFYGQRYTVDCKIKTEVGEATVRSNWIIRRDEDFPRLTTCFVKKEKKAQ